MIKACTKLAIRLFAHEPPFIETSVKQRRLTIAAHGVTGEK